LAVAGAALFLPGTALAATTIDFDGFPPDTQISNQYANFGGPGEGVTFGTLPGGAAFGFNPVIKAPPAGQAHSGTQVGDISVCNGPGCESYTPSTVGTFGALRSQVSARVGYGGTPDPHVCTDGDTDNSCAVVTLLAYDTSGNEIASSSPVTVSRGAGFHSLVAVATATASIAGFKVTVRTNGLDNNKTIAIDDLSFATEGPPGPADFSLSPASTNLVMRQGATLTDAITIGRFSGSTGNVQLALSGPLPAGVHAAFVPNPAGGTSSDLVLTADPDAASTGFNPVTLTVTGTPLSPSVGSIGHSFTLSLQVRSAFDVAVQGSTDVNLAPCVVNVPVQLVRDFGLSGPIDLAVTGQGSGVQASFAPAQATFPGGAAAETVALVVTAPESGFAVRPQTLTIHAVAAGLPERTATVTVHGTCPARYDARVTSLQITQGAQSTFLPSRNAVLASAPTAYSDIPEAAKLRGGGPTIVRVYANVAFGPTGGVPNVPAVLYGATYDRFGAAHALPGSPILPTSRPSRLSLGPATADPADVFSETNAYTFTLPPNWTHGQLAVGASLLPSEGATTPSVFASQTIVQPPKLTPCVTPECIENDSMGLSHIPFLEAPTVTVRPVQMTVDGKPALPDPTSVFSLLRAVNPLPTRIEPYAATIDITDVSDAFTRCTAGAANSDEYNACSNTANEAGSSRLDDWVCDNGAPSFGWDIGVNTGVARGLTNHYDICWSSFSSYANAVVEINRPLTSIGHEFFHLLGRPHASKSCGGNDNGQTGEAWPPDEQGYLQSVGLDPVLGSGIRGGPYALVGKPPGLWFDFMSYCANTADANPFRTGNSWISVRNWNAAFEEHRYHRSAAPRRLRATGPRAPSLHVSGFAHADGTVAILSVAPVNAPGQPASESGYHLVGSNAAGATVADLQMLSSPVHTDTQLPALALDGVIPAAGVVSVAIVKDGVSLATRAQSAHAPKVSVSATPAFRSSRATIRWRGSDADTGPLVAAVDYSRDGGKSFHQVWSGPSRGRAQLPARVLSRARNARIRVRLNDGFRESAATSRSFSSPGDVPDVQILSPRTGLRQPNDAPLVLSGQAFDDTGKALSGKRLQWLVGKRLVGTGTQTAPSGLAAGRHRVQLVARDSSGRVGRASIVVRLAGARPLFLVLSAPKGVKRSARSLRLKVSTSLAARLTVRGGRGVQRFFVSRKTRTLAVRVSNGAKQLTLRLALAAGGKQTSARLSVPRR
jgi:hypothetical protein